MNKTALKLIVTFWHDEHPQDPREEDWNVYSFNHRHENYKHPDEFEDDEAFQAKLTNGFAFPLSYYEHGQCVWSLANEGPRCQWDSVSHAGYLVWEQDEENIGGDRDAREADARRFVDRFTQWCNGQVYGYTIDAVRPCGSCGKDEDVPEDEHDIETIPCGGFYVDSDTEDDMNVIIESIRDQIGEDWADYEIEFKEQEGYGLADEVERRWKETS